MSKLRGLLTQPVVVSSVVVTALLVGMRQLGLLEALELGAFDRMVILRGDPGPDPRLLVVGIGEQDIQQRHEWPLSDQTVSQLLGNLEQYKPRAIGLDLFRDLPVEPGHRKLQERLQLSDRVIPICKHSDSTNPATPPPPGVAPDRVGFSDIVEDTDGIVRRNLLLLNPDPDSACSTPTSFSLQLALRYLAKAGIDQAKFMPNGALRIGATQFNRLQNNAGGYQKVDPRGYQILLNYRSPHQVARQISLTEALGKIDPNWVQDRLVLIGTTAPSGRDVFNTPFSANQQDNPKMAGIVLHAQMVSQILSAVLQRQPQFWFWPEWGEVVWIGGWSLVGGILAWYLQHPLRLGLGIGATSGALFGICFGLFTQAGWVPLMPAVLGLVLTSGSVVTYRTYQTKQQQERIARQVQEQERTIALLQALLREEGGEASSGRITVSTGAQPDTLLGNRYQVIEPLKAGGFSQTYLAEDIQRPGSPQCVIKHLQPARSDPAFLEIARRLFATEAEIYELLGHHEQIPQLLAYFEASNQFYLVQEFVKGHDLSQELCPGHCVSESQVANLLKDVLEILVFVHHHQVIHRDVKPSNIIRRDRDSRLVLIDFGAVKQIQPLVPTQEETQTVAVGTAGYAPAEQLLGQPHLNSDVYALGVVGIQALTGIPPTQLQHDLQTGALVWRHLTQVSPGLAEVLDKMVRYHFSDRYPSAKEALRDLEQVVAQTG